MPDFLLPYGCQHLRVSLPLRCCPELIAPPSVPRPPDPHGVVQRALATPVGGTSLRSLAGVRSAAIALNDKTRPVPHGLLLPPLLAQLHALGLQPSAITLIIATGSHPPIPPGEFGQVIPSEIVGRYPVYCHDADDEAAHAWLGQTHRGTPVWIDRRFLQADLRIVVGSIEPHQFMGFSGGVKSAAIGLAGLETINRNHALLADPRATLGRFEDNPARQDVEEIGRLAGVHFALNAILSPDKAILDAISGEPATAMREGVQRIRSLCHVLVPAPFDLLVASAGGHPRDISLYQAQKAVAHAAPVVREGGTIIIAAACSEGVGSQEWARWMVGVTSHQEVVERIQREGFRVGPHKALLLARDVSSRRVFLASELAPDVVRTFLLTPTTRPQDCVSAALQALPPCARVGVMPAATAIVASLTST